MKLLRLMICVINGFFLPSFLMAQDYTFSQFYEMPLLRNPAISGLFNGDLRLQSSYRTQWSSFTTPFQTMALSAEVKTGVGTGDNYFTTSLLMANDVAGDSRLSRLQVMPAVNYLVSFNDGSGYLAMGFMGGMIQSNFDPSRLYFDDQFQNGSYNPSNPTSQLFTKTNETHFDMGAGFSVSDEVAYGTQVYVGAALYHLNKPKMVFSSLEEKLKRRFVLNLGASMELSDNDKFIMYGDYITQAGNRQGLLGLMFSHSFGQYIEDDKYGISFGTFYRWADAVIPVIKLELRQVTLGLSYDSNVSKLSQASYSRGAFELTASFKSFLNIKNSAVDKVKCTISL